MSETECPTCGRGFDTEAGVKQHHYAAHGESIAGAEVECDWCGNMITKRPSHVNDHNFCNRDHRNKWMSDYMENKVDYGCDWCGDTFKIHPYRLEEAEHHFCPDSDCQSEWKSETFRGENHHLWNQSKVECEACGETITRPQHRIERSNKFYCDDCWGESFVKIECEQCGGSFDVRPSRKGDARFCGFECKGKWQSEEYSGAGNPLFNRVEVDCDYCGEKLSRVPSRVRDYDRQFCDLKCEGNWISENRKGEENPSYDRVERNCSTCGQSLMVTQTRAGYTDVYCDNECRKERVKLECEICEGVFEVHPSRSNARFCSFECTNVWRRARFSGEGNPAWKGGIKDYAPGFTHNLRKEIRERDGFVCQGCGVNQEIYKEKVGLRLDVHHIDGDKSNHDPDNLIAFCRKCHSKWEGIPLRPVTS